jgi:PPM family protein phosphatase
VSRATHPDHAFPLTAAAATHVGHVRKKNEDAVRYSSGLGLFAVADGMGGHAAGEVAARLTMATLYTYLPGIYETLTTDEDRRRGLARAIERANATVFARAAADEKRRGMGSTIVAALWCPPPLGGVHGHWALAHVGDSRAYAFEGGEHLRKLTDDHSAVFPDPDHGEREMLTRAIGNGASVDVTTALVPTKPGDRLLLCSDGLYRDVSLENMARCLRHPVRQAVRKLVDAARDAGGSDNISAVVVEVGPR